MRLRTVASLIAIALLTAAAESAGQSVTRRPTVVRRVEPIPGQLLQLPPQITASLRKQLESQIANRNKQQAALFKEAQVLRLRHDAAPQSPDAPAWLCHAGMQLLAGRKLLAARDTLQQLVAAHPDTPWEREARLALCDLSIEADLDVTAARTWLAPIREWARHVAIPAADATAPLLPGELPPSPNPLAPAVIERCGPMLPSLVDGRPAAPRTDAAIACDVYLRSAALDFCCGNLATARVQCETARRLRASLPLPHAGLAQTLLMRPLADAVATYYPRQPPTDPAAAARPLVPIPEHSIPSDLPPAEPHPADLPEGTSAVTPFAVLLRYGEMLHQGRRPARTLQMLDVLLKSKSFPPTPEERAYALIRRAEARAAQSSPLEREPDLVLKDLDAAYKAAPQSFWAGEALLRAGNAAWNLARDEARAIDYFTKLLEKHPDHRCAAQAAYSIGIRHEIAKRWDRAYMAFYRMQQLYPNSGYEKLVEGHLSKIKPHLPRTFPYPKPAEPTPIASP